MTSSGATTFRTRVRGLAEPIARGFGRLGLTPNHLTLIGFGIAILAAAAAVGQEWLLAGLLVLFGGAFDLLDGALARATGRVSRFGAFMDSVFDRWGEGVIYVGIAYGCVLAGFGLGAVLAAAALASAVMVSYTRAKSEGLGFTSGTGMASVGLAPREVRIVLLALGLVGTSALGGLNVIYDTGFGGYAWFGVHDGSRVIALALGLIAILATITTLQRIVHVVNQSRGDSNS
ncbi:MAG TPA: CDP-alcohol phosphatidyltransferase family protein [Candidatus Polarisedimenticolia bacterium]|nr:CDP-alcohol phosphatidyltransferase family protein [Candidatus Polarisedimenticolia bacterium]